MIRIVPVWRIRKKVFSNSILISIIVQNHLKYLKESVWKLKNVRRKTTIFDKTQQKTVLKLRTSNRKKSTKIRATPYLIFPYFRLNSGTLEIWCSLIRLMIWVFSCFWVELNSETYLIKGFWESNTEGDGVWSGTDVSCATNDTNAPRPNKIQLDHSRKG